MTIHYSCTRHAFAFLIVSLFFSSQTFSQTPAWAWGKSIGSSVANDYGTSVAVDAAGNVYTTGGFTGTNADFDPGPGVFNLFSYSAEDIFVSKLDANGDFVWAVAMGGMVNDNGNAIAVDGAGNVYITGTFAHTVDFNPSGSGIFNLVSDNFSNDIFVCKLSSSGNFIWAKALGGPGNDNAYGLALDASANVYLTGFFSATADFDPGAGTFNLTTVGYNDIFFSRLDSSGNFVWAKSMGATANYAYGQSIFATATDVYLAGSFATTVDFDPNAGSFPLTALGNYDGFVCRFDNSGNLMWAASIGATGLDNGFSISADAAGNVYTCGLFMGVVDFDPGPATFQITSAGIADIFVSKLNSSGDLVWAKSMGGAGLDEGRGLVTDASGNVYITGTFNATADFDPGNGTFNLTATGGDIFLCKLDASGNFGWAKQAGGTSSDIGASVSLSTAGSLHLTGHFFSAGITVTSQLFNADTSATTNDIIIAKTDNVLITGNDEIENFSNEILLAPNPATGPLVIRSPEFGDQSTLTIYDVHGQRIFSQQLRANSTEYIIIDVSRWNERIYFVKLASSKHQVTTKLLVQH